MAEFCGVYRYSGDGETEENQLADPWNDSGPYVVRSSRADFKIKLMKERQSKWSDPGAMWLR